VEKHHGVHAEPGLVDSGECVAGGMLVGGSAFGICGREGGREGEV